MGLTKESFGYDSDEYSYLTDAVELAKYVNGACIELGLRLGRGTATIMEGVSQYSPNKYVVSVDPYGSIPYEHREGQICRLDYTNQMKCECLSMMYSFSLQLGVKYDHINLTDTTFFEKYGHGLWIYDLNPYLETKYSVVHLDGPHGVEAIKKEIEFFSPRMDSGAMLVIDDISIDFVNIDPINDYLISLGWEILKQGGKKGLYKKI